MLNLLNRGAHVLRYNVPMMARAASSGLSALVMGRPITKMLAPSSRAWRGFNARRGIDQYRTCLPQGFTDIVGVQATGKPPR